MASWLDSVFQRMLEVPEAVLLFILGFAALVENVFPPVPADVIILFGGFLVGKGASSLWLAFVVVWLSNVAGAVAIYVIGRVYGPGFFAGRLGRYLLRPRQLSSLSAFYHRFGFGVIFFSRFLPMFRSVVPVFAGVTGVGAIRTLVPVAMASGIWYGGLLYLGSVAGQNWQSILAPLERSGRWLGVGAVAISALLGWWWMRSRRDPPAGG